MSTVAEIESAIEKLPLADKLRLLESLGRMIVNEQNATPESRSRHSLLDIRPVSVGQIFNPHFSREHLLEEMLEERL